MTEPVTIYFELEDMLVEAPLQSSFMDVVQESGADVTFGCRNGTCGTCHVFVEKGLENLSEPEELEQDLRADRNFAENERLACQAFVRGDIAIKLR